MGWRETVTPTVSTTVTPTVPTTVIPIVPTTAGGRNIGQPCLRELVFSSNISKKHKNVRLPTVCTRILLAFIRVARPRSDETYTVDVPGEQLWQDGRIRVDSGGYEAYYDAVDACWVSSRIYIARLRSICYVLWMPVARVVGT